ncbi:low-density lipoprotein receptor repeat domain-containing protein cueball isoform X1 [Megalopta genalis]|uniref:low-density lipoprotein receptor repeat domain-containing protein cueball isoform X1 n=1 Tax=Megalopta genalis TaxID=115081 RepID=UPI003FD32100
MRTMTSREYLIVTLTIVFGIHAVNTNAKSWDLAVTIGREIEFFSQNQSLTRRIEFEKASSLAAFVYDDSTQTLFLSDTNSTVPLFSSNLLEGDVTTKPLYKGNSNIVGLAYDDKTRNLFWTDTTQGAIIRMHVPLDGPPGKPTVLHKIEGKNLHGIAVDPCNSHIYWVNSDKTNQCIERSNFDGTDRVTIVEGDMYKPLAIAIDHAEGKLYWTDASNAVHSEIERSNLDGTDRELVIRVDYQQLVYIAVDRDTIYWSDWVHRWIWSFPKNGDSSGLPSQFVSYHGQYNRNVHGIVTRYNAGIVSDCKALAKEREMNKLTNKAELRNNLPIITTEESESITEKSKYCLNGGVGNETDNSCHCKHRFTGKYCEIDLCHNYCLQGSCSVDEYNGLPICKCNGTFVGPRCATDPCKDYCLHDGQCSVQNEKPVCKCKYSEGSRCEDLSNTTKVCGIYCAKTESVPKYTSVIDCSRCDEANKASAQMVIMKEHNEYKILIIFGVLTAVLIVIIIVLSFYVNKLRRRPGNHSENIFDAENCCNMNICETPCFEPKLSTAVPERKGIKKEEKNCLLDNMEKFAW